MNEFEEVVSDEIDTVVVVGAIMLCFFIESMYMFTYTWIGYGKYTFRWNSLYGLRGSILEDSASGTTLDWFLYGMGNIDTLNNNIPFLKNLQMG